jgi:hypothetical protein
MFASSIPDVWILYFFIFPSLTVHRHSDLKVPCSNPTIDKHFIFKNTYFVIVFVSKSVLKTYFLFFLFLCNSYSYFYSYCFNNNRNYSKNSNNKTMWITVNITITTGMRIRISEEITIRIITLIYHFFKTLFPYVCYVFLDCFLCCLQIYFQNISITLG